MHAVRVESRSDYRRQRTASSSASFVRSSGSIYSQVQWSMPAALEAAFRAAASYALTVPAANDAPLTNAKRSLGARLRELRAQAIAAGMELVPGEQIDEEIRRSRNRLTE